MISNSSKYAIKAVLYLSLKSASHQRIQAKDVAKNINVPQAYTAKLLQELSRQKIISSIRGPRGGFYLSEENKSQSLFEIIKVIDGEKRIHACILEIEVCDIENPCPMHDIVYPSKARFLDYMKSETIGNFSKQIEGNSNYFEKLIS